jgi:small ligand-binding sensory domain FIST
MCWASALSRRVDAQAAVAEVSAKVLATLGGPPDLALLFASTLHAGAYDAIAVAAQRALSARHLVGCSATGVVGAGQEVQRSEALTIIAARLPGVGLFPFHLDAVPKTTEPEAWTSMCGVAPEAAAGFIVLADPISLGVELLLRRFDGAFPGVPKIGGVLSGVEAPGDATLFWNDRVLRHGVLGLGLSGRIQIDAVVAQGCRPIGQPMIITRCRDSVIYEFDIGRPAEVLQGLFERLEPRDQELSRHSLFVGVEMQGGAHRYGHGDFLIRSMAGLEPRSGAMAVNAQLHNYQVVQFHLRDARTAAQDLEQRLVAAQRAGAASGGRVRAGLLFSCTERGEALYGVENHDSDLFCRHHGAVPIAGVFANGEIGPVGGRTFLHGNTSVFGVLSEPPETAPASRPPGDGAH